MAILANRDSVWYAASISRYSVYTIATKLQPDRVGIAETDYAMTSSTIPENPLILCDALATRLNG